MYLPHKLTIEAGQPFTFVVEVLSRYEKEISVQASEIYQIDITSSDYNRINYVSIYQKVAGTYQIDVTAVSTDQEIQRTVEVTVLPSSFSEI